MTTNLLVPRSQRSRTARQGSAFLFLRPIFGDLPRFTEYPVITLTEQFCMLSRFHQSQLKPTFQLRNRVRHRIISYSLDTKPLLY